MRRLTIVAAAVTAAFVLGSMLPVASQPPGDRTTIELFEPNRGGYERFINEGKRRISPGDTVLFRTTELDPETCEKVGNLWGRVQIIKVAREEDAVFAGEFTVFLEDGKITAGGAGRFSQFENPDVPVFAVTGGTGAYKDASGDVTIIEDQECGDRGGSLTRLDLSLD